MESQGRCATDLDPPTRADSWSRPRKAPHAAHGAQQGPVTAHDSKQELHYEEAVGGGWGYS